MSQADFQTRLERINEKQPVQATAATYETANRHSQPANRNFGLLAIAAIFMSIAIMSLKSIFEDFEAIRANEAWGALGISVAVLLGAVVIAYWLLKRATPEKPQVVKTKSLASPRAKTVSSVIGLTFGAIGGLYSVLGAAVAHLDTEQAKMLEMSGTIIPVLLLLFSLLLGFIGLFARRLALGRIPIYCLIGTFLFVIGFRMSGADITDFAMLTLSTM